MYSYCAGLGVLVASDTGKGGDEYTGEVAVLAVTADDRFVD